MTPLRAGLIGLGQMGRHHARVLQQLDCVQLVAAADPAGDPHRVARGIPVHASVEHLLDHDLDYCVLAAPAAAHHPIGLALARAGIATLIEKPLGDTAARAAELAAAFTTAGVAAGIGHIERFNPAINGLRERLADGQLGRLHQITTRRTGPLPTRIGDTGVVMDLATHDIDLVTHITGQNYASITAQTAHLRPDGHEDLLAAVGLLDDGTVASHHVNWLSPLKERLTVVTGDRGCLVADTLHGDLTYYANGSAATTWPAAQLFRGVTEGDITRYAVDKREPLLAEHEAWRDTVLGHTTPIATLAEGAATVAIAELLLASAAHPRPLSLAAGHF